MSTSGIDGLDLDDTTTQEEYQSASSASRAQSLAMELSKERKRLKKELAELQTEVDDLTPTTPTAGFTLFGQVAYVLSSMGWVYVGMAWSDRAIMIGSAISGTAVMMNIVTSFTT